MYLFIKKNRELLLILSYMFYTIGSKVIKLAWTEQYAAAGAYLGYTCVTLLLVLLFLGFVCDISCVKIKKYLRYFLFTVFFLVSAFECGNIALLINVVFVLMLSDISFEKILKHYLFTGVASLFLIVCLCYMGILADVAVHFEYGIGHSYGLSHPNNLAGYMFTLVVSGWHLYGRNKIDIWLPFVVFASYISLKVMASRTICISLAMLALGIVLERLIKKIDRKYLQVFVIALLVMIVVSSFLLSLYNNEILGFTRGDKYLDNFLCRFADGERFMAEYGVTAFGSKLPSNTVFDLSYVRLFVEFGVVASVLHYLIVIKGIINCKGDYRLLLIICIFMLIGFMETSVYYIFYNPYLLLAFCKVGNE